MKNSIFSIAFLLSVFTFSTDSIASKREAFDPIYSNAPLKKVKEVEEDTSDDLGPIPMQLDFSSNEGCIPMDWDPIGNIGNIGNIGIDGDVNNHNNSTPNAFGFPNAKINLINSALFAAKGAHYEGVQPIDEKILSFVNEKNVQRNLSLVNKGFCEYMRINHRNIFIHKDNELGTFLLEESGLKSLTVNLDLHSLKKEMDEDLGIDIHRIFFPGPYFTKDIKSPEMLHLKYFKMLPYRILPIYFSLKFLENAPNLEVLDLQNLNVTDEIMKQIMTNYPKLKSLSLGSVSDVDLKTLARLPESCPLLETLDILRISSSGQDLIYSLHLFENLSSLTMPLNYPGRDKEKTEPTKAPPKICPKLLKMRLTGDVAPMSGTINLLTLAPNLQELTLEGRLRILRVPLPNNVEIIQETVVKTIAIKCPKLTKLCVRKNYDTIITPIMSEYMPQTEVIYIK